MARVILPFPLCAAHRGSLLCRRQVATTYGDNFLSVQALSREQRNPLSGSGVCFVWELAVQEQEKHCAYN